MLTDIEIAQNAKIKNINEIAKDLEIDEDEIELYGKYKAKLNDKLTSEGKIIVPGKIAARYFYEHIYI